MNEQEKRIQELTQRVEELTRENVRLRGQLAEAIGKACFNCEEYIPRDDKRCGAELDWRSVIMEEGKRQPDEETGGVR